MAEDKFGLGEAAFGLDISKPMLSRISDDLVPPPNLERSAVESRYNLERLGERISRRMVSSGIFDKFKLLFQLKSGAGFILKNENNTNRIRPLGEFMEAPERLLEVYNGDIKRIDLHWRDRTMTFSSFKDLLEWTGQ